MCKMNRWLKLLSTGFFSCHLPTMCAFGLVFLKKGKVPVGRETIRKGSRPPRKLCQNVNELSSLIFSHFPIFCFNRQSIQVDPQAKTATFPAAASQGSEGQRDRSLQTSTVDHVKRGLAAMAEEAFGIWYEELKVGSPCARYPGHGRRSTRGRLRSLGRWPGAV